MKMYPVVHFEMPAKDRKRMSGFYRKAFGWQTNRLAILPNLTHYEIGSATELAGTVLPFLDGGHRNRSKGE